jgi:hypothetical protein
MAVVTSAVIRNNFYVKSEKAMSMFYQQLLQLERKETSVEYLCNMIGDW